MRIRALAVAGVLLAVGVPDARAQSQTVQKAALEVYQDYAVDGRIDPCKHSSKTLKLALDNVPPDIEQYASEYPSEIQSAIEARARGECAVKKSGSVAPVVPPTGGGGVATPGGAPTPAPTPVPTEVPTKTVVPEPPGPDGTATAGAAAATTPAPTATDTELTSGTASNDAPLPVLLLGVLAVLLALTALLFAAMRRFGIADDRLAPVGHAFREARWRAGGTWEDFLDWVRTGR
jgi:hypothetical protein